MPYATSQDLRNRFGDVEIDQLTDRNGDGTPDPGAVNAAIADAEATVNSYLGARYTVPLEDPAPAVVMAATCDLARARLYDDQAPEIVTQRRTEAIEWLTRIAKGTAVLNTSTGRDDREVAPAVSTRNSGPRRFTRDRLKGFTG